MPGETGIITVEGNRQDCVSVLEIGSCFKATGWRAGIREGSHLLNSLISHLPHLEPDRRALMPEEGRAMQSLFSCGHGRENKDATREVSEEDCVLCPGQQG